MVLIKVAILGLLRLQSVTVNDVVYNLASEPVTIAGPVRIKAGNLHRKYAGSLHISRKNDALLLLLTTSEEDLVAAIASAESPPGAPPAALEAQAILARSWLRAARNRHGAYDFCDTTHCQHFKEPTARGIRAAARTRGLVLHWQDQPFAPAYSASCGGKTQTAAAIGWRDDGRYPYFAVDCPICQREEPPWTRRLSPSDLAEIRANPHNEATRLAIGRRSGWDALPGNNYTIRGEEITGRGQGHGLGYCQRGGAGLARQGKSAAEILHHYLPATALPPKIVSGAADPIFK